MKITHMRTPKIVSFHLYRQPKDENPLRITLESFQSLHRFIQIMLLIFAFVVFVIFATSFIVNVVQAVTVFPDNFESGNTSSWTSSLVEAGNTLEVIAGAAQEGSYGLHILTGGINDDAFLRKSITATPEIYTRFMMRLVADVATGSHYGFQDAASAADGATVGGLAIRRTAGDPTNSLYTYAAGSNVDTSFDFALNTWYCVETHVVADATAGRMRVWVDGNLKADLTGLNTGASNISYLRLGADGANLTSEYYFDGFVSDNSMQIGCGAVTPSPTLSPPPTPAPSLSPTPDPSTTPAPTPTPAGPASPTTTIEVLELISTYESISVYANFAGDTNWNNIAVLEYRPTGTVNWIRGMDLTVDRRATVENAERIQDNSRFVDQWRGSILLATHNTEYEVRVIFTDPDGISGTNPVVNTVRTRIETDQIPSIGRSLYVAITGSDASGDGSEANPWRTIQRAANSALPGDTVYVKAGTYNEAVYITSSGASNNYITFRNFGTDLVVINPPGDINIASYTSIGFIVDANYLRIKGFEISDTWGAMVLIDNAHDVIIEDNTMRNYRSHGLKIGGVSGALGAGFDAASNVANITAQRNTILATMADPPMDPGSILSCCHNEGGHVIRSNTIEFRYTGLDNGRTHGEDCIGSQENSDFTDNFKDTDIYGNTCKGSTDDAIEMDGDNVNTRVWNNIILDSNLQVSIAASAVGPTYVFRNVFYNPMYQWTGCAGIKEGRAGSGHVYFYHNTMYLSSPRCVDPDGTPGGGFIITDSGGGGPSSNIFLKNNIFWSGYPGGSADRTRLISSDSDLFLDYNLFNDVNGGLLARYKGGSYYSIGELRTGTGFEINGIAAVPLFTNPALGDFHLLTGSPGIDAGAIITGFNDQNSAWPYRGVAPDMGAFEITAGATAPTITVLEPSTAGMLADETFTITWQDADEDDNAAISLYYDTDAVGEDGTLIVTGLSEDSPFDQYTWNTLPIPDGDYYVYATITDGTATATDHSEGFVTLLHVNDPPVAQDDAAVTDEDTPVIIDVLANDTDVELDPLTVTNLTQPSSGTATLNADNTVTYTPNLNFNGVESFTYTASDGTASSTAATVTIIINPVNDPPVAVDDAYATNEDTPYTVAAPGVLENDEDVDAESVVTVAEADSTTLSLIHI